MKWINAAGAPAARAVRAAIWSAEPPRSTADRRARPGTARTRYLIFAEDGRAALSTALSIIADPGAAPVVVHCMAGKDRTGVTCALALALVGVSDEDIAADYALTTTSMRSLVAHLRETNPAVVEGQEHMFDSPAEAMLMFLTDLRAEHGSVENYARLIGIKDEQVAALRDHLLE